MKVSVWGTEQLVKLTEFIKKRMLVVKESVHFAFDESNCFHPYESANVNALKRNVIPKSEAPQEKTEARSDDSL